MSTPRQRPVDPATAAAGDALARLLREAGRDAGLRARLLFLLNLPAKQRESLVNTALEQMQLRGEPADARAAFAVLATEEGARAARNEINPLASAPEKTRPAGPKN